MPKTSFLDEELAGLKKSGRYTMARTLEGAQGSWILIEGRRVLNLCSNDYLGLANHNTVKQAVKIALDKYGSGSGGARLISGTTALHRELERKIASFKHREGALVFASGVHANTGTIPALAGEGDVIFTDELNHGSIIDGCRLTQARKVVYSHRNTTHLMRALEEHRNARRRLIVTDGVFSMDGSLAPLPEIVELAERYDAMLMVDDAHGEGVLGAHGCGIVDHFGLHGRVEVEVGTFSKAFGVSGGFVCGATQLVQYLAQTARTFLFSSAPTPMDVAACIAAIEILERSDDLVKKLWSNTLHFKAGLKALGFDIGFSETPIVPLMLGEDLLARKYERELFDEGVFTRAITPPAVPKNAARLRIMISASHDQTDLDFALEKFEKVKRLASSR